MKFDYEFKKALLKIMGAEYFEITLKPDDKELRELWEAAQSSQRKKSVAKLRKLKYSPKEVKES